MEYKQERFSLNKFCEFSDRETEADFMKYDKKASLNSVQYFMLLMGVIFVLFGVSDFFFYREHSAFILSLILRFVALCITVVAFFQVGKIKLYNHTLAMVTLMQLTVFGFYLLNLYILDASKLDLQFMSIVIFILVVFLIPNVWKNSLFAGCVIVVGYTIFSAVFLNIGELPALVQRGIYLSISVAVCAILLYSREKSRRKQFAAEKLLEFMSITDRLTGIYNRGRFEYILGSWIKNMRHNPFCLLLFDIDNFKKVNDRFGHTVGDEVLIGTAAVVSAHIRDDEIFARWGGEEFVILFGTTGIERATELAERLRKAVEDNPCSEVGHITISIGAAEYRQGETITEFVNRADEKMYEAKKAGKNRVMA